MRPKIGSIGSRWVNGSMARCEQVDEEAEGSGDGFGELAVKGEGAVGPASLADRRGDQASALGELDGGLGASGVVGLGEDGVVGVEGVQEAVASFFYPAVEVGWGDLVGCGEEGVGGGEKLDGGGLVDYLFAGGEGEGIGGVFGGEVGALVLDEDIAAVACEVQKGMGEGSMEFGVGGVGSDAKDDRVEVGEICGR